MKKILFSKYNSHRKPEFQVKTSIFEEDGNRYVVKTPMCPEAVLFITRIRDNYELLNGAYKNIKLLDSSIEGDEITFPFVEGKSIDSGIDYLNDSIDDIVEKCKKLFLLVNDYDQANYVDFAITPEFEAIFKECNPKNEVALKVANIDAIFSNFIANNSDASNSDVICMDYEWVFDFPVPCKYILFRTMFFLYMENIESLGKRITVRDFLYKFDFNSTSYDLYNKMEDYFQDYIHGEDRKYIYTKNYEKNRLKAQDALKLLVLKEEHINNLDELNKQKEELIKLQQEYIDKLRKAMRNPFFACKLVAKKLYAKGSMVGKYIKLINYTNIKKAIRYIRKIGIRGTIAKSRMVMTTNVDYEKWITNLEAKEKYDEKFEYNPKISVIVPVYNVLDKHLVPCIESVINQIYDNWELCLADDCSTWDNVRETLKKYEQNDKVKVVYRTENGHISRCTNSAIEVATGEYIALLDCDDLLRPNALYEVVKLLNEDPSLDYIYSDEDKVDDDGKNRHMPHFKPDWSPDTLMSNMYTCHFSVFRKSIVDEIGGLRAGYEGSQDYDFALRFTEKTDKIGHIAKILYHWRERNESTSVTPEAKPYILEAARKSKEDALERRGLKAELELVDVMYQWRVNYISRRNPLVSIVIPSKDNYEVLARCISSLVSLTSYKNYEIILVDNGSNVENKAKYSELASEYGFRYIYQPMTFNFSKMCNIGADNSNGEFILFLNDDIEIIEEDWLGRMVGHAELDHIGAVGAKLLYPDKKSIQHLGVINIQNGPIHPFTGYSDEPIYYFGRNRIDYNYLAVTAACMLVNKEKFYKVGGFCEELMVAYNDVDLCCSLVEAGYFNVVRNDVKLIHHESVSRGDDRRSEEKFERLMLEQKRLYERHPKYNKVDPFYNVNLAQNKPDFSNNV